ncbi:MAG: hydratase [Alphaproteobacteria bacterium]|nr:hydratase [Alphaproteobacteria bacterium]
MTISNAERASDFLWDLWEKGEVAEGLPPELAPKTREEGYAIQFHLDGRSEKPLAGWKIAASNRAGQEHLGVDGPLAGRILAERVVKPGATVSLSHNRMRVCEPEFAFRLERDIPPRETPYSVEEVLNLVDALHLVLELPDSRFKDFATVGGPALIADNACAHDLVLGPPVAIEWRRLDLASHPVKAYVAGKYDREGSGANVLGDPRIALAWLINEVTGLGLTMRAKEFVTTGTSTVPLEIVEGDDVMADFGELGQIQVYIAA